MHHGCKLGGIAVHHQHLAPIVAFALVRLVASHLGLMIGCLDCLLLVVAAHSGCLLVPQMIGCLHCLLEQHMVGCLSWSL